MCGGGQEKSKGLSSMESSLVKVEVKQEVEDTIKHEPENQHLAVEVCLTGSSLWNQSGPVWDLRIKHSFSMIGKVSRAYVTEALVRQIPGLSVS